MLKIPTPKPFATIPAINVGDVERATKYDCENLDTRVPTVIARSASTNGATITGAELFRVCPAAGRRMRALAEEFGHWWANHPESDWGGISPFYAHTTQSNSAHWEINPANGDTLAEVRLRGQAETDAPVIIIEAPIRGEFRVHIAGYLSVWTPSGWDHATKPAATGAWMDADANGYAWSIAKDLLKALGAPATLSGSGPVLV